MNLAPIVLFVYNRPEHTRQTLEALRKNYLASESKLIIYSDGPKSTGEQEQAAVGEVRRIISQIPWPGEVEIIAHARNIGLADNIIRGVSETVNRYGSVIVMEDDLVTGKGFLKFMNEALTLYEHTNRVMHISGYMFPVKGKLPDTFFHTSTSCWGWATWKRAWDKLITDIDTLISRIHQSDIDFFNIDGTARLYQQLLDNQSGKIHTWACRWHASVFLNSGLCLHPGKSLVRNIGHDNKGTHCEVNRIFLEQEIADEIPVKPIPLELDLRARKAIKSFYKSLYQGDDAFHSIIHRVKKRVVSLLKW